MNKVCHPEIRRGSRWLTRVPLDDVGTLAWKTASQFPGLG
jgi:hypothetical protein